MADLARALPRYGNSLPSGLQREAAELSSVLEHLTVEARQVSAQLAWVSMVAAGRDPVRNSGIPPLRAG